MSIQGTARCACALRANTSVALGDGASGPASLTALVCCACCRAAERREDMVGLLHTKGYSSVIDMTGEEKNGRRVL